MPVGGPRTRPMDPVSPEIEAIRRVGIECRLLIIRHLLDRPMRFHELQRIGIGVDAKTLSRVLTYLGNEGIVHREVLATRPVAVRYSLTEKGRQLKPVLDSLDAWARRWVLPRAQPLAATTKPTR